ncbi:MAG: T9SS type A sorting domain-containing protein, partial [Crocinitomicaceae bacterium]|nr:T9SS type A sorting domain-containing protein [Crocinitomicaceae bacterium]
GPAWVTAGDWITGTPYPIFNVEDPDRTIFTDYQVPYYPLVYKICPDKKTEWISTSLNTSQLYQKVQDCQTLSIEEEILAGKIYIDQLNKNLIIENYDQVQSIEIINLQGQKINSIQSVTSGTIDIHTLETGIYIFQMNTEQGPVVRKLFMN